MSQRVLFENYSPVGDLTVVSICFVMIVLMIFSYIRKTRSFVVFTALVGTLMLSAFSDVIYYSIAAMARDNPGLMGTVYAVRCVYHAFLFLIFVLYVVYICEVTRLGRRPKWLAIGIAAAIYCAVLALDVAAAVRGTKIVITESRIEYKGQDIFMYGYLAFVALIIVLMIKVRNRLYKRVMMGFYGTMAISFLVLLLQGMHGQSSFTVVTFAYPIIAMFYIMHSNPYDAELGAIDSRALEDTVRYNYQKKRNFIFMSLYLRAFDEEGKLLPESLQATIRSFAANFFKGAMLFQVSKGHVILLFTENRNPDYEDRIIWILRAFDLEYEKFKYDYKIVIGNSIDEVSRKNEYVSFIRSVHRGMAENSIHRIGAEDVKTFNLYDYILRQLEDIHKKGDLDDPRVLAYCQPVFNIKTGRYDTAEALMRMQLPDVGLVFPDQFIHLAEENGYIHTLTQIILHKTCEAIRRLMAEGRQISRVSVNVSVLELKDDHFCDDIIRIIDASGIPGEKIAIELTESQSESDFLLMKSKIAVLRERGIKFYLDDFGTGYSNMERIFQLPFDIIKFDRSLVLASGASERSRKIVLNLANMFDELDYSVLYEGVEGESDERMCIDMSATYLQGYKYSRPVPIADLMKWL